MILIGTDEGLHRWFEGSPWPIFHSLQGRSVLALAAPGGGLLAALDGGGRLFETTSNGMDWRPVPLPGGAGRPTALTIAGTPGSILIATKSLGLFRRPLGVSADPGGSPWEIARRLAPALVDRARSYAPKAVGGARGVAATAPRPVGVSTVDLAGWTSLAAPGSGGGTSEVRVLAASPGAETAWYAAVAGAGLSKSADSGASWARCSGLPDDVYALRFAPGSPGLAFAATSDGCWISSDGGETWADNSEGLGEARHIRAIDVKPGEPQILLAGAAPKPGASGVAPRDGLRFALYESADGGKTWSHVKRGAPEDLRYDAIVDIRFDPAAPRNIAVALGSGELWCSRNGGEYWGPLARQMKSARALAATA